MTLKHYLPAHHKIRVLRRACFRDIMPKCSCFYRLQNFFSLHYGLKKAGWSYISSVFFIGTKQV